MQCPLLLLSNYATFCSVHHGRLYSRLVHFVFQLLLVDSCRTSPQLFPSTLTRQFLLCCSHLSPLLRCIEQCSEIVSCHCRHLFPRMQNVWSFLSMVLFTLHPEHDLTPAIADDGFHQLQLYRPRSMCQARTISLQSWKAIVTILLQIVLV